MLSHEGDEMQPVFSGSYRIVTHLPPRREWRERSPELFADANVKKLEAEGKLDWHVEGQANLAARRLLCREKQEGTRTEFVRKGADGKWYWPGPEYYGISPSDDLVSELYLVDDARGDHASRLERVFSGYPGYVGLSDDKLGGIVADTTRVDVVVKSARPDPVAGVKVDEFDMWVDGRQTGYRVNDNGRYDAKNN